MKKINALVFVVSTIIISACGSSGSPAPTPIKAIPSVTQSPPTVTITPTSLSTPTPIPHPVITSANIMNIQEDFRIGMGFVTNVVYLDNETIAVLLTTGLLVYDAETGNQIKYVQPENKAILEDSEITLDGKYVASLVNDEKVLLWNADNGEIEYDFETKCQPILIRRTDSITFATHRIAIDGTGSHLAVCDEGGVSLWDLSTRIKTNSFETGISNPYYILFSPDDAMLASSSFNDENYTGTPYSYTEIAVWDLDTGDVIKNIRNVPSLAPIAFNHKGNIFAYLTDWRILTLFDIFSGKTVQTVNNGMTGIIEFSRDDNLVATNSRDYKINFWNIETGKLDSEIPNWGNSIFKFSPDGQHYLRGGDYLFITNTENQNYDPWLGGSYPNTFLTFDPDGAYLAVGNDGAESIWDLQNKTQVVNNIPFTVMDLLFESSGDNIISRANDGQMQVWDLNSAQPQDFEGNLLDGYYYGPPKMSSSTNIMATGVLEPQGFYIKGVDDSLINNGYIRFWDIDSKKFLFDIKFQNLDNYEFSPDGKVIALSGNQRIEIWDPVLQKKLITIESPGVIYGINFSPDGKLIAGAQNNRISIWETSTGNLVQEFHEIRTATIVKFNPQGNILAAIGYVGNNSYSKPILYAWDISSKKLLYTIDGDEKVTYEIPQKFLAAEFFFSPDGSLIATKGFSDFIQFFDSATGQMIKTLDIFKVDNHTYDPNSFSFSFDGRMIAVAAIDGIVHILSVAP